MSLGRDVCLSSLNDLHDSHPSIISLFSCRFSQLCHQNNSCSSPMLLHSCVACSQISPSICTSTGDVVVTPANYPAQTEPQGCVSTSCLSIRGLFTLNQRCWSCQGICNSFAPLACCISCSFLDNLKCFCLYHKIHLFYVWLFKSCNL